MARRLKGKLLVEKPVVGHVKVVGILMMIHGILVCLMGAFIAAMGPLILAVGPGPGGPPPAMIAVVYIALGVPVLLCGFIQGIAGLRVMQFRNRTFAIVAVFLNIIAMMSCYCIPTGIAMMVYGLIVLLNSDVGHAFEMVGHGATPEQVIRKLTYDYDDDYDDMYDSRHARNEDPDRRRDDDFDDDYDRR